MSSGAAGVLVDVIDNVCGSLAFRYEGALAAGDRVVAERARLVDGSVPADGDVMLCGSCGRRVDSLAELRLG